MTVRITISLRMKQDAHAAMAASFLFVVFLLFLRSLKRFLLCAFKLFAIMLRVFDFFLRALAFLRLPDQLRYSDSVDFRQREKQKNVRRTVTAFPF